MPRPKQPPIVISPAQRIATYKAHAANLRNIASLSRNHGAKEQLLEQARGWDLRAEAAAREANDASAHLMQQPSP